MSLDRPARLRRLPASISALVLASYLVSCSDGGTKDACGPIKRERVDPASSLHLLPGVREPEYLSDPPTSGPHQSGPQLKGVLQETLERPVQVAILERGDVLIQYRDPQDAGKLKTFVEAPVKAADNGSSVVIAPNPDLSAPIIATAWAVKQTCEKVDEETLREFIENHPAVGRPHT